MSFSSAPTWKTRYTANGSTDTFAAPTYLLAADLKVYVGTTLKTITTDYTLNSGNVVFNSNPANASIVTIVNDPVLSQGNDLTASDEFSSLSIENQLDRCMTAIKVLSDRCMKAPLTDAVGSIGNLPVAATRASQLLGFDASGDPKEVAP